MNLSTIGQKYVQYLDGFVSYVHGEYGPYDVKVLGLEHVYPQIYTTNPKKLQHGQKVRMGRMSGQSSMWVIVTMPEPSAGTGSLSLTGNSQKVRAFTWSQMEGNPELHRSRWTTTDTIPKIFIPTWDVNGFPPATMFESKPTNDMPFVSTFTPTQMGAYSPLYGFVAFPNKTGQQCFVHAYWDYNPENASSFLTLRCYNLADPAKNWTSSGAFGQSYVQSNWDQTNNWKIEPNQKRLAYNKEEHLIVVFGTSYSNSPFQYSYAFNAEDGFSYLSALGPEKTLNNISFGKNSIMSAWWRSVRRVVPTVMIPTTSTPNMLLWSNSPTGTVDLSSVSENYAEIWKRNKISHIVDGSTSLEYSYTQKLLKSMVTVDGDFVLDCASNNNLRWPYSSRSDAYAVAVSSGSGLNLANIGHRMALAAGVGYNPPQGYYTDIWTTPENPATEISATVLDRYRLHTSVKLDIYIHDSNGTELYHDTITKNSDDTYTDSGTFEYTSPAIPFSDGEPVTGSSIDTITGFHVEVVDPPPDGYVHYEQIAEEHTTVTPGTVYSSVYLGYLAENSQNLANTLAPISYSSEGMTGSIVTTEHVDDWEDPSPISYWAYGEGFHYHKEWGVIPEPSNNGLNQVSIKSGSEDLDYHLDSGANIQFPVLSILQGLPCVFPLPIRNNLLGWSARLFSPTDTSQFGGNPLPSNASGVFDTAGNYYIAYAIPEVWIRGCADQNKYFTVTSVNHVAYDTAALGRKSYYWEYTNYRRVSALTGAVNESNLPYPTATYNVTGFEVYHGKDAYAVTSNKFGMIPVSETVYRTYLRKVKYTPGAIDSHGVEAQGTYATDWDINFSYYLQFISPTNTPGDFVETTDARGTPIPIDEFTSYLPLKWFPLVDTPRPTLEQIWSITPVKSKVDPKNLLIVILDKRVDQDIKIESVPFLYIFNSDTGAITTNIDIAAYVGETINYTTGLYRWNYYYHEDATVSEAIVNRGGPEILVNHDNAGNSVAIVKIWMQDRTTLEKAFRVTVIYLNGPAGLVISQTTVAQGLTGSNGWSPYDTLKALGSFKNCAFGDVIYFYDVFTKTFKKSSDSLEPWENNIVIDPPT